MGFRREICPRTKSAPFKFGIDGIRSDDLFAEEAAVRSLSGSFLLHRQRSRLIAQKKRAAENREKNRIPFSGLGRGPDLVATESGQALAGLVDSTETNAVDPWLGPASRYGRTVIDLELSDNALCGPVGGFPAGTAIESERRPGLAPAGNARVRADALAASPCNSNGFD